MSNKRILNVAALITLFAIPAIAFAGMPRVTLTDIGAMRLQTLSFFAALFLVSSWIVQKFWNALANDFTRLPRLGYWRATSLVSIWALLFVLVLTMISGARELLTPGAWEKVGATYKLSDPPTVETDEVPYHRSSPSADQRRESLERLRFGLQVYSWSHKGQLPPHNSGKDIAPDLWVLPTTDGVKYEYVTGLIFEVGDKPLAFEPPIFDGNPWVLFSSGKIKTVPIDELTKLLTSPGSEP